jgi:hypothetical protein
MRMPTEQAVEARHYMQGVAQKKGIRVVPAPNHPLKLHLLTPEERADSNFYVLTACASGAIVPGVPGRLLEPYRPWMEEFNDKYRPWDLKFDLFTDPLGCHLALLEDFPYSDKQSWEERLTILFNVLKSVLPPTRQDGLSGFGRWIDKHAAV